MAFHFSLQAVLHFRQSIEHQQELRLRAANQQVAAVEQGIVRLEARREELRARTSHELSLGMTAAELQFGLQCEAQFELQRRDIDLQLGRVRQLRDQQRAIFQQARRMRQTLEGVREEQLKVYRHEMERREQRAQDDLFLLRREYLRRS
jgi:flagellar export protein FliJ